MGFQPVKELLLVYVEGFAWGELEIVCVAEALPPTIHSGLMNPTAFSHFTYPGIIPIGNLGIFRKMGIFRQLRQQPPNLDGIQLALCPGEIIAYTVLLELNLCVV
jgi:hypothetical protein